MTDNAPVIENLRYLLLVVFNAPIVIWALTRSYRRYSSGTTNRSRFLLWSVFWFLVALGLALAKPVEDYLFDRDLTRSPPLSNFDVIELSGIIWVLYFVYRAYVKVDALERQIVELNRNLSIHVAAGEGETATPAP